MSIRSRRVQVLLVLLCIAAAAVLLALLIEDDSVRSPGEQPAEPDPQDPQAQAERIAEDVVAEELFFGGENLLELRQATCDPARAPIFECTAIGTLGPGPEQDFFYLAYHDPAVDDDDVRYLPNGVGAPSTLCADDSACIRILTEDGTESVLPPLR